MQLFSAQPGYRQMKLVRGPKQQVRPVPGGGALSETLVHWVLCCVMP